MNLSKKKLFLLDMDGTIYIDDQLFDGTLELLDLIREKGGRYIFMTNNSSRGLSDYVKKLKSMGIEASQEDFVTSVDATVQLLKNRYGQDYSSKKIYLMGTDSLKEHLTEQNFNIITEYDDEADAVLCGFDRQLTYKKLEDVSKLLTLKEDIDYFATNPDWVCPTDFGYVPDCGCMCAMIEKATGREPYYIGKPRPDMVNLALARTGFKPSQALVVGDRFYTDIVCGQNAGVDTCFLLSGEGTLKDAIIADERPTYVMENIRHLFNNIKK